MHSPYAYASKRDLLEWVARLLDMDLTSLDDVRYPTLYLLFMHLKGHTFCSYYVIFQSPGVRARALLEDSASRTDDTPTLIKPPDAHASTHSVLVLCCVPSAFHSKAMRAVDQRSCLGPNSGRPFCRCGTHAEGMFRLM